jgi:hypothetical protein
MIKAAIHKSFRWFGLDIVDFPPRDQTTPPDFRDEEISKGAHGEAQSR